MTCAGGGLHLMLACFCARGKANVCVIGGRETRYGRQASHPPCTRVRWVLVFERMLEARCALGTWSGCARWRPIARAGGDVRGERARPEFRIEGAKAGVQGMRVRVRARAR